MRRHRMETDAQAHAHTLTHTHTHTHTQRHIFVLLSIWGLLTRDSGLQGREGVWGGRVADGDRIRGQSSAVP